MGKTLPAKGFFGHTADFATTQWAALDVPEDVAYADLYDPTFWRHYAGKLKPGNLIRMRRVDGAWDVMLNVVAAVAGGVQVEEWPKYPSDADEAAAEAARSAPIEGRSVNGKPVPRVEHTPATLWRVIGLDGNEVRRGFKTKTEAEDAMRVYAASLGKELAA